MKVRVEKGLLWDNGLIVGLPLADWIAQANGYMYVERMVKEQDGMEFYIDDKSYVIVQDPASSKLSMVE